MSCRIITGQLVNEHDQPAAYLYDSVTGWAFGPQFASEDEAALFLLFLLETDPRGLSDPTLDYLHGCWLRTVGKDRFGRLSIYDDDTLAKSILDDVEKQPELRATLERAEVGLKLGAPVATDKRGE